MTTTVAPARSQDASAEAVQKANGATQPTPPQGSSTQGAAAPVVSDKSNGDAANAKAGAGKKFKKIPVAELLGISNEALQPEEDKTILTSSGEWSAAEAITKAIPKDYGVPMTILTGFLGAGKSTVLNYILKADHGLKIAVLINEFGLVDIDSQLVDTVEQGEEGEPIMLNNGCVCCTISSGFQDAVRKILDQSYQNGRVPDYFIVETTGLADPKPIMDSVSVTELRDEVYIDQVLTVVDSSVWSTDHYESDTAIRQIENADTVLLSKTDLADEERIKAVVASIVDIRPSARILRSQKGYVPIAALFDLGISLTHTKAVMNNTRKRKLEQNVEEDKAKKSKDGHDDENDEKEKHGHSEDEHKHEHKEGEHKHGEHKHDHKDGEHKHDHKDGEHKHDHKEGEHKHDHKHDHKHGHDHHDHHHDHGDGHVHDENCNHEDEAKEKNHLEEEGFTSVSFVSDYPFSMRRFKNEFMDQLPPGVFRSKGLLWFVNEESRFIFHWSGQRFHVEEQEWPEDTPRKNQLVIIGRQFERDDMHDLLQRCVVKPGEESEDEEEEYVDEGMGEMSEMTEAEMAAMAAASEEDQDQALNGNGMHPQQQRQMAHQAMAAMDQDQNEVMQPSPLHHDQQQQMLMQQQQQLQHQQLLQQHQQQQMQMQMQQQHHQPPPSLHNASGTLPQIQGLSPEQLAMQQQQMAMQQQQQQAPMGDIKQGQGMDGQQGN